MSHHMTVSPMNRALIADCFTALGQQIAAAPDGPPSEIGTAMYMLCNIVDNWQMQYVNPKGEIICMGCLSPIWDTHVRGCAVYALQELVWRQLGFSGTGNVK